MEKLTWSAILYSTGVDLIDNQHKALFDLINKVIESFEKKLPKANLDLALRELGDFVKEHFSCEENLMTQRKCSSCDANKKAHHMFLNEFTNILTEFRQKQEYAETYAKFVKLATHWLRSHIMAIDTKLKDTVGK